MSDDDFIKALDCMGDRRHFLLANVVLVGESIMLAMRAHFNVD